jgi:hypothetical protein
MQIGATEAPPIGVRPDTNGRLYNYLRCVLKITRTLGKLLVKGKVAKQPCASTPKGSYVIRNFKLTWYSI